jgi:RNA polymerase sigma factor (sigma-70 family)
MKPKTNASCGSGDQHPWRLAEPAFQSVLELWKSGADPRSAAWDEPLRTIERTVFFTACQILRSPRYRGVDCDPHHAVQQFHVQLFEVGVKRHRHGEPFFPYAYVMLVNICRTQGRRGQKRSTRQLPIDLADRVLQPWRRSAGRESRRRIRQALRLFSPAERTLIADKYWRRLTSAEIGARRGLRPAQVDQRIFRIRAKLRRLLSPGDGFD